MKKWIAGLAATIISGIVIYWFTEGILRNRSINPLGQTLSAETTTTAHDAETATLSDIIKDLESTDVSKRISAAIKLGNMGKTAMPAFPALVKALNDSDLMFVEKAAEALLEIDEVAARPYLIQLSDRLYQQRGGGVIDGSRPEDSLLGMLVIWID